MPKTIDLTGLWEFKEYPHHARRMRDLDKNDWLPASVPSSIYTSLMDTGLIDKNDINTNPEKFIHISEKPWIYKRTFNMPTDFLDAGRVDLVFDGLDTITQIWLNDKLVGKTDNMFIPHRFNVTNILKNTNNTLLVKFNPSVEHSEQLMKRYGLLSELYYGYPCRTYIRKAQYQFGWDWCPALPGCGIWRSVRLESIQEARIKDIHLRTIECNDQYADIKIAVEVDAIDKAPYLCKLTITDINLNIVQSLDLPHHQNRQSFVIRIDNPALWWPRGYGDQHLYTLDIQLTSHDEIIDQAKKHFGLRTVRLNRSKDRRGENFQFEVNGQPIYAKGANWVPPSIFPGLATTQDYEDLLTFAADANINMLRIWGGGYYENHEFYRICDRHGIMVWQDFMFGCAYYPDRRWFTDAVKKEAATIIKQLRNHPSLVLWCGNNEIDWQHSLNHFGKGKKFYGKSIYHKILPHLLSELDPDRDYIPTTPLDPVNKPNNPTSGTTHEWDVWRRYAPTRNYLCSTENIPRFVTEFGLQALPDITTIKTFCEPEQLRIASKTIEKHNYQFEGNPRLARYFSELFAKAKNLEDLSYLSQLTQARSVKKYVEYLRTHNSINHGALFWQFNDCCPAISFSAIDYLKRPKALYYYARRFFAPIMVTAISQHQKNIFTEPFFQPEAAIIINDSPKPITATLTCLLLYFDNRIIDQVVFPIALGPFSVSTPVKLPKTVAIPNNPERCMLRLTLENQEGIIAENLFFYLPDKHLDWPDSQIIKQLIPVTENQWKLTLKANTIVKDLQILTDLPSRLSDNFIDILADRDYQFILEFDRKCQPSESTIRLHSIKDTL